MSRAPENPPKGQRFSKLYIERGSPTLDSKRLRTRLHGYFTTLMPAAEALRLARLIQNEVGVIISQDLHGNFRWRSFFEEADVRDLLDSITLIWMVLRASDHSISTHEKWVQAVRHVMQEENAGYRVDDEGGVHYDVDQEFERNRAATVAALQAARYGAALAAFEDAHRALDRDPPDGKTAIRETFDAIETVFKLMFNVSRLSGSEVGRYLKPFVQKIYEGNEPAINAANQFLEGFAKWTNAAHQYRHAQNVEEPTPPPVGLAIAMMSTGASYLRWLAELDQQMNK